MDSNTPYVPAAYKVKDTDYAVQINNNGHSLKQDNNSYETPESNLHNSIIRHLVPRRSFLQDFREFITFKNVLRFGFLCTFWTLICIYIAFREDLFHFMYLCIALGLYIIYWVDIADINKTARFLLKIRKAKVLQKHVEEQERSVPSITWRMEGFQWKDEDEDVYTTDFDGNLTRKTETYRRRDITQRNYQTFKYKAWKDVSEPLSDFSMYAIGIVDFNYRFDFEDHASRKRFYEQKDNFANSNKRTGGLNYDIREDFEVPGQVGDDIYFLNSRVPFWINFPVYMLCCVLTLELLYSFKLARSCIKIEVDFKKQFSC